MKCVSVNCHIIVLRFESTLAWNVEKLIGVAKAINGLHRIYVNIFGKTKTEKHDPLFVYLSLVKTIEKFQPLFQEYESVHFFTDGGPHHYKSRHGILGFLRIVETLSKVMDLRQTMFPIIHTKKIQSFCVRID